LGPDCDQDAIAFVDQPSERPIVVGEAHDKLLGLIERGRKARQGRGKVLSPSDE
jgi:hypothetical protein